jgi:hypothetical protein
MPPPLRPLAFPLILILAGWPQSAHAEDATSGVSEVAPGPVFSTTGPDAEAYGALLPFFGPPEVRVFRLFYDGELGAPS